MRSIFDMDSPVMQAMNKLGSMIWISLLWLLCCLPVVTIGASTAALYRMMFNLREDKTCTAGAFFRAFTSNFKQASLLWLIEVAFGAAMIGYYWFAASMGAENLRLILVIPFCLLFLLSGFLFLYVYPLTCYFENNLGNTLRNALILSCCNPKRTIPAFVLSIVPVIAMFLSLTWFMRLFWFWILVAPGLLTYWICRCLEPVFRACIPEEDPEK